MKLMICVILIFCVPVLASKKESNGYLIKSSIEFTKGDSNFKRESEVIVEKGLRSWTVLSHDKGKNLLLGRVARASAKDIKLNYLFINLEGETPVIESNASLIMGYNSHAQITSESDKSKVSIGTLVQKTAYK